MKTKKTINEKASLKEAGVLNPECKSGGNRLLTTDMTLLTAYWRDIDCQRFIQRFKWKGLPENIPAWRLEQMLYYRGSLVFFKAGKDFFLLPYASSAGFNLIGLPNAIQPVSYNGASPEKDGAYFGSYDLKIDNNGVARDEKSKTIAVLLFDRYSCGYNPKTLARFALSQCIIHELCNRFAYLDINLTNSQGKYIIICKDEATKRVVEQALDEMLSSTKSYTLVRSAFEVQVINNKVEYAEQGLWEDIASWNSLLCDSLGIAHGDFFNKKERKLNGEIAGNDQQTKLILENGLTARKNFINQVKKIFGEDPDFKEQFGEDFDVEISDVLKEKEEVVTNENTEEEGANYGE